MPEDGCKNIRMDLYTLNFIQLSVLEYRLIFTHVVENHPHGFFRVSGFFSVHLLTVFSSF